MKAEKQMNSILPAASSAGLWGFFCRLSGNPKLAEQHAGGCSDTDLHP